MLSFPLSPIAMLGNIIHQFNLQLNLLAYKGTFFPYNRKL